MSVRRPTRGNADGGQRFNTDVNAPINPTNTQSPGSGRQQYPYVYVGVVKNKDDPDRMGRIAVYIREIHGAPDKPHSVVWCDYATPFGGGTPTPDIRPRNDYDSSQDAYGMWFPVPDLENEVLVMFVNGDLNRGVWFACLYKQKNNAMIPEPPATITDQGVSVGGNPVRREEATTNLETSPKPEYAPLARGLKRQGLEKDDIRGRSTSSAVRQNVSTAYGIRTPRGSAIVFDDGFKPNTNPEQDETSKGYNPSVAERGGNPANKAKENKIGSIEAPLSDRSSELIRLRTRSGAQILVHETEGIIYMINRDGTAWIELARDGKIDVYGQDSISVHSYGSINLTAQDDVNIEAGRNINMKTRGTGTSNSAAGQGHIYIQSTGSTHLTTGDDLRLLVGKNQEILVANNINVRSDNWDQNVNIDHNLCICENQNIKVGKERKDFVKGNYHLNVGDASSESNLNVEVKQHASVFSGKDIRLQSGENFNIIVGKDKNVIVGENQSTIIGNDLDEEIGNDIFTTIKRDQHIDVERNRHQAWTNLFTCPSRPGPVAVQCPELAEPNSSPNTPIQPEDPEDPVNPELAKQPIVNTLKENSTYKSSISNRVPEHEPWEGHLIQKPGGVDESLAAANPTGTLDDVKAQQALPPVGSPAFVGAPQGGGIKGNTSGVPATKDIGKIQSNITDAAANPATSLSLNQATSIVEENVATSVNTITEPIVSQLVSDIAALPSTAGVPALISTAISDIANALETVVASGLTVIEEIVTDAISLVSDATDTIVNELSTVAGDIASTAESAAISAVREIEQQAPDLIASTILESEVVDGTLSSTEKKISNAVSNITNPFSGSSTSQRGQMTIAFFERYVPFYYPYANTADKKPIYAIGYRTLIRKLPDEKVSLRDDPFAPGLTEEEAWQLLIADIKQREINLSKLLKRQPSQNQFDAMMSITHQLGGNSPAVKAIATAFNNNDIDGVVAGYTSNAATFAGKFIDRRESELEIYLKGIYPETDRTELKKQGLKEFTLESWIGEHLWKLFPGYLHKEFPDIMLTRRVIVQAFSAYDRSTEKSEFSLPLELPENKLSERMGGNTKLKKLSQTFAQTSRTNISSLL